MDLKEGWSNVLYKKKYIEFDRTLLGLYTLNLLKDGSIDAYHNLVDKQSANSLSLKNFILLSQRLEELLNSHSILTQDQVYEALQTGLILQDIGKTKYALNLFERQGVLAIDQNHFYSQAIDYLFQNPALIPSFERLPKEAKELLWSTREIAHYGHISHLEGGPEMFSSAKSYWKQGGDLYGLKFDCMTYICEVAGALGHIEPYTSLVLTDDAMRTIYAVTKTCAILEDDKKNEMDAFLAYAKIRLEWVDMSLGDMHFDVAKAKLIASLRIYNKEEACQIERALKALPKDNKDLILDELNDLKISPYPTPTYVPVLYINYINMLVSDGISRNKAIRMCILNALPKTISVVKAYRKESVYGRPLCFNSMAGFVKRNPDLFSELFCVDQNIEVVVR